MKKNKYRVLLCYCSCLRLSNKTIKKRIVDVPGALELLFSVGFRHGMLLFAHLKTGLTFLSRKIFAVRATTRPAAKKAITPTRETRSIFSLDEASLGEIKLNLPASV